MKTTLLKLLAVVALVSMGIPAAYPQSNVLLIQTTSWYRAEATVPELPGLTIEECVQVLNLKTDFQINIEEREDDSQPRYRLDLVGLEKQPIEEVLSNLLAQTGDYVFARTNKTINLIPKEQWNNTNHVFNAILSEYVVKEQNLVGAWELLCHRVPALAINQPVGVAIDASPKWIAAEKADASAGSAFSLKLTNSTVRTVINAVARKFGESYWDEPYWAAKPSHEVPPKWQWIVFYEKSRGKFVLWEHDPGLHELWKRQMEGNGTVSP